jgi:hypothetical protein
MTSDSLTTERIRKKFKNNFDLCNFSINIARNMILGGNSATLTQILVAIEARADECGNRDWVKK